MSSGPDAERELMDPADTTPADLNSDLLGFVRELPDGILFIDRHWRLAYANDQARRISRIRPEDMNSRTHWEIYPSTVGTEVEEKYRLVMDGGPPQQLDFFYGPFLTWYRIRISAIAIGIALYYSDITALRETQQARDVANAQLEEVFETTTDGILSMNRDWQITSINRSARSMLAEAGDLVGRTLWNHFPDAVYEGSPFVENYFRSMHHGERRSFEAFYPAPLNMLLRIESLPSESGIIVFFRDITHQRADEDAVRASEQRYRVLTELNPQAIWTGAPDGRITYVNQRLLEYIGQDTLPHDRSVWSGCIPEEDRQILIDGWRHSVRTGEEFSVSARLIRAADGAVRWWHLRALPLRDDAGAITLWLGVGSDVHEIRTASERLRLQQVATEEQRAQLEAIYQTAPIGLALFDPVEFRYMRINDRQAENLGLPKEEILGRTVLEVTHMSEIPELFRRVAAGESIRNHFLEGELPTRRGDNRTFNVNYAPVADSDGHVTAISAAIIEITQQRRAEAALVQSEKLAAVGRLASSISHEINNPLEAITNLLYLASAETGLPPIAADYINTAQAELTRVSQIATQTLRFHRQANDPSWVTAAQLVDAVLNLYQGRLANSGIRVEAAYSTAIRVRCFENDIRQVLNNLIGNAIDAMRNGGRLRVRAHEAIDFRTGDAGLRITVADDGHGMSPEIQRRIFEAFYTTKQLNGTGLGLWICEGIVKRHNGSVRVRSTEDPILHGTVFTLFLPMDGL